MAPATSAFEHFISVDHGVLMDGRKPFRFVSFNVPNLNYIEDDMQFRRSNPYRLPTEYEMRDAFATVAEMGGRVLRIYSFPVKSVEFPPEAPSYVLAPGQFDEDSFRCFDSMLALANEYGIRIVVSLVSNYQWMGGRPGYAAFRGKQPNDFWTDRELIDDFKATIRYVLGRTNTVTGVPYRDDKAILCWETGSELFAPFEWTAEIARFIKSLDPNHLVMDGGRGDFSNAVPSVQYGALVEPAIDIVTTHHYETDPSTIPAHIENNIRTIAGRKAYIIGEFGFVSTEDVATVLSNVIARSDGVVGVLLWSLRFHNRDGGFYWHSEPYGGIHKALHWPGFPSGQAYDEAHMLRVIRRKAFEIQGMPPPQVSAVQPPVLLPIDSVTAISWRGAMGATGYVVERAEAAEGPWETVGPNVSDSATPYFPLFNDTSAVVGGRYYYRVRSINSVGASIPSNVVGPVTVAYRSKIDTMRSLDEATFFKKVEPVSGNDRKYKEIRNRLAGNAGSELVYSVPGRFRSFVLHAFEQTQKSSLTLLGSVDGNSWTELDYATESFSSIETIYDYWRPKIYSHSGTEPFRFVKIVFTGVAHLARAEITYLNRTRKPA